MAASGQFLVAADRAGMTGVPGESVVCASKALPGRVGHASSPSGSNNQLAQFGELRETRRSCRSTLSPAAPVSLAREGPTAWRARASVGG